MEQTAAPLIEHLKELRTRLLYCIAGFFIGFILCFSFATQIFNFLVVPYTVAASWLDMDLDKIRFVYTAPQEFFFTQIKIAAFGALVLAFPIIATQIYRFVAPGLYSNEKSAFAPFLIATPVLFLVGAALVYYLIIPMAMWFFLSLEQPASEGVVAIENLPKVSEYLSLIMTLIFAFGLVFQLPVAMTLLGKAGLVSSAGLADKRKYAIVIAFIAAAILTPPDPLTQLGLALPTLLLYELSIYLVKRAEAARPKSEYDDDDDEDEAGSEVEKSAS
jgi:sec-independent protein translocase protein TatC